MILTFLAAYWFVFLGLTLAGYGFAFWNIASALDGDRDFVDIFKAHAFTAFLCMVFSVLTVIGGIAALVGHFAHH